MIKNLLITAAIPTVINFAVFNANAETKTSTLSCIKSVCGSEDPFLHPFEKSKELKNKTMAMISAKMEKPLKSYMGRVVQRALILDTTRRSLFKRGTKLTSEQAALVQSMRYADRLLTYKQAYELTPYGLMLNRWKLKSLAPKLSDQEVEALVYLSPIVILDQFLDQLKSVPYEIAINILHQKYTVIYGQVVEALAVEATQKKIAQIAPDYDILRPQSLIVEKAKKGEVLSPSEQKIMIEHITTRIRMDALTDPTIQEKFAKLSFDINQVINEAESRYQQSETAQALKNPESVKKLFNEGVGACLTGFSYSYAALPSQTQIATFQKLLDQVILKARSLIDQKNGGPAEPRLRPEIYYPIAKENVIREWQEGLDLAVTNLTDSLDKIQKLNFDNEATRQSLFVYYSLSQPQMLFDEVFSYCRKAAPPFLQDSAIKGTSIIHLTWPTIVHPELGIPIMAHELGHVATTIYPRLFKSEGRCLIEKQESIQYVDEDFADLFSAEILKPFNGKIGSTKMSNLGCGLLVRDKNILQEGTIENLDENNIHSSPFYRLLATAKMTNTMTKECTEYLNKTQTTQFSEYCEWQK